MDRNRTKLFPKENEITIIKPCRTMPLKTKPLLQKSKLNEIILKLQSKEDNFFLRLQNVGENVEHLGAICFLQ